MTNATRRAIGLISVAMVGVAVAGGLFLLGSPAQERMRRFDEQRVDDLRTLATAGRLYWTRHKRVPAALQDLPDDEPYQVRRLTDPESGQPYEYRAVSDSAMEVCATFNLPSENPRTASEAQGLNPSASAFWSHGAGRHCYVIDASR